MILHPGQTLFRLPNDHARQALVSFSPGDSQQIIEILILAICVCQDRQGPPVHAAKIARVSRISASINLRRRLQYQRLAPGFGGLDRRTKRRVAAANYNHIPIGIKDHKWSHHPRAHHVFGPTSPHGRPRYGIASRVRRRLRPVPPTHPE